jgi:tetratricopeptide (TPR) repeat protein
MKSVAYHTLLFEEEFRGPPVKQLETGVWLYLRDTFVEPCTQLERALVTNQDGDILESLYEKIPDNERGDIQLDFGNFEQAIIDYTRALEQNMYNWLELCDIHRGRGKANLCLCKYEEAIKDYDKVLEKEQDMFAYTARGDAYRGLHKYKEAIEDYDRAMGREPEVEIYKARGDAYCGLGKYEEAIEDYSTALIDDYFKLLELYPQNEEYRKVLELYPQVDDYSKILEHYPPSHKAILTLSVFEIGMQKMKAVAWEMRDRRSIYEARGDAYFSLCKYDEAIKDYIQVLRPYSDDEYNRHILEKIERTRGYL